MFISINKIKVQSDTYQQITSNYTLFLSPRQAIIPNRPLCPYFTFICKYAILSKIKSTHMND